jgi:hypothetical protein
VTGVALRLDKHFARLYEQDAPQEEIQRRIGQYVRRWKRWVLSGVQKAWEEVAFKCIGGDPAPFAFESTA